MIGMHQAYNGRKLPIAALSDSHLTNVINAVLTKCDALKEATGTNYDAFSRAVYNIPQLDDKAAGERVREMLTWVMPYLAEAYLRGLDEPREHLRVTMDRDSRLESLIGPDYQLAPGPDEHVERVGELSVFISDGKAPLWKEDRSVENPPASKEVQKRATKKRAASAR